MAYAKWILKEAMDITKEYARGGGSTPDLMLRKVVDVLAELNELSGDEQLPITIAKEAKERYRNSFT